MNRKNQGPQVRVVDVEEMTCVYQDLKNTQKKGIDFDQEQANRFIRKVRRSVPLKRIDEVSGYILQMDPVMSLLSGTAEGVNQSLCIPLAKDVTSAKGFETITFPSTKALEIRLGQKAAPKELMGLMKHAIEWVARNNFELGYFWRLQNRFAPNGTVERVAQVEVIPAV